MSTKVEKLFIHDFGLIDSDEQLMKIQRENPRLDPVYITACCVKNRTQTKEWLESLWAQYQPYAEPKFLDKIRKESFHAHSWSMYIGVILLEKGLELLPNSGIGPDLQIKWYEKNLWIEAAVTTPGDSHEAGGLPSSGDIYKGIDPRIARITNSFTKKYRIFKDRYEGTIVKESEPFIIAINGTHTDTLMGSRALEAAVYGRGNDVLRRTPGGKFQGGFYESRREFFIQKDHGRQIKIEADYFCSDKCQEVSAVIYCEDHIINSNNYGREFGENLYTAFNLYAENRLEPKDFPIGQAIVNDKQGGIKRL